MLIVNKENYIWYVCYGSNLCYERFLKYINKCSDTSEPRASKVLAIHYQLYFGNSSSKWNGGGVCFIKKSLDDITKTHARAYLITKEQYEEVRDQEGRSDEWYGHEIELDPIDDIPARTFTSKTVRPLNKPSREYLDVVRKGLLECGLTLQEANRYLRKKAKNSIHTRWEKLTNNEKRNRLYKFLRSRNYAIWHVLGKERQHYWIDRWYEHPHNYDKMRDELFYEYYNALLESETVKRKTDKLFYLVNCLSTQEEYDKYFGKERLVS